VIKNWRAWVLLVLLVGPVLAYIGFGTLWLLERRWLLIAGTLWIISGLVFAVLASRWTRARRPILPPIDWDAPHTFSPEDRKAWTLVEEEAEKGDTITLETLSEPDVYIETGRRLARRLADHYHPLSADPIDHVPVVELLTALQLAAEDLNHLCHQVPGGDLITPSHWKRAVQAAGYLQRANEIYSYLLPIFSPVTGLVRLGTQQWMVKPAWRNMQQNLLRWFFRAYVNRLGTHLIELYSGRLVIGADQYRRLTRRSAKVAEAVGEELGALTVAVAGARDSGKSRLIEALDLARAGDLRLVKARLESSGLDPSIIERLKGARWVEVPGYTVHPDGESARDRATRRDAVAAAVEADLLVLVVDGRRDTHAADVAFAQAWDRWYVEHPVLEAPPTLVVVSGVDRPEFGGDWKPPYDWSQGRSPRESAVRSRIEALRVALPPTFGEILAVGLPQGPSFGVAELVLPALATLLHKSERAAVIRHLRRLSTRSKARRLIGQVGEQGRWLWSQLTSGHRGHQDVAATSSRSPGTKTNAPSENLPK
jgi:hypothetical protein